VTVARRPGCAPRPLPRPGRRPAPRRLTPAQAWDAARPALALVTAIHTGTEVDRAEILRGYPPGPVLEALAHMAIGFARALVHAEPDGDEIVTGILQRIGLRALEEVSR